MPTGHDHSSLWAPALVAEMLVASQGHRAMRTQCNVRLLTLVILHPSLPLFVPAQTATAGSSTPTVLCRAPCLSPLVVVYRCGIARSNRGGVNDQEKHQGHEEEQPPARIPNVVGCVKRTDTNFPSPGWCVSRTLHGSRENSDCFSCLSCLSWSLPLPLPNRQIQTGEDIPSLPIKWTFQVRRD
jgi:hypothetical protein